MSSEDTFRVYRGMTSTCPYSVHQRDKLTEIVDRDMPMAVVLFARDVEGRILAISRRDDSTQFGLPGGKVDMEDGPVDIDHRMETLRRSIIREVREEIGVALRPEDLWCEFQLPDPTGYWNFCFGVDAEAMRGAATQEGEGAVCWVDWEALETGPFGAFNRALRIHLEDGP